MSIDPNVIAKKKDTNLKKFGGHPMKNSSIVNQRSQFFIDKYGVDNPFKSERVKDKIKNTNLDRYGETNPSKSPAIKKKLQETAIDRFTSNKDEILNKRRLTNLSKFGSTSNSNQHIDVDAALLMKDIEWLTHQHLILNKSCAQIAKELGTSPTPILSFMTKNGITIQKTTTTTCHNEILDFIRSMYDHDKIIVNDRKTIYPLELDILLPEKNIAIELNGVYWHSESSGKNKDYHLNKTKLCEAKNIHLLHIYDVEWLDPIKNKIIKSKIRYMLNNSQRIYARKCKIQQVSNKEATQFLIDNHIQGSCPSKIKLGLYLNDRLVALMTLGQSRFNSKYSWELIRYCSILDHFVVGGLSKLLQHSIKTYNINKLISYADRRWTSQNHNIYDSIGFTQLRESKPNYKYFNINDTPFILKSRNQFQKHLLKDKLKIFDDTLGEYQNMLANKYYRIWDCGNLVYEWNKK
jgi:hypothetical protein